MKNFLYACFGAVFLLSSCQQAEEKSPESTKATDKNLTTTPCDFISTDSATAQKLLLGEWDLAGIKTNSMGAKPDEFLTGGDIGTPKGLAFYSNNEFEESVNGQNQGERQKYELDGQSITPLASQFWFCGDDMLVLSNVAADGPTEVYIRK